MVIFAYAMVIDKYKDPIPGLGDGVGRKLFYPASQPPGGSSNYDGERRTLRLCAVVVQAVDGSGLDTTGREIHKKLRSIKAGRDISVDGKTARC